MPSAVKQNHKTLDFTQGGYLSLAAESFLTHRKASGKIGGTIEFYKLHLKQFITYCDTQAMTQAGELTADFLRKYLLLILESHNAGGVQAAFRTLRAFMRWLEFEEVMPPEWRNPVRKVKAPRVSLEPLEPVSVEDIHALIDSCKAGHHAERDKAIFLFLLDTGLRARELCNLNLEDVDAAGSVLVRKSKSKKPRTVYIGRTTRRALRAYLHTRDDNSPVLFATIYGDSLTYTGLREILRRRTRNAGLKHEPTLPQFRRAFALNMLRNGADVISLQRLMGHSDLSVLRRYLAQTEQDIEEAHRRASPVDNLRK